MTSISIKTPKVMLAQIGKATKSAIMDPDCRAGSMIWSKKTLAS